MKKIIVLVLVMLTLCSTAFSIDGMWLDDSYVVNYDPITQERDLTIIDQRTCVLVAEETSKQFIMFLKNPKKSQRILEVVGALEDAGDTSIFMIYYISQSTSNTFFKGNPVYIVDDI